MEGDYDDCGDEGVRKEGGKGISATAVDSNVCDDGAASDAADTDADGLGFDAEFHVVGGGGVST